MGQNQIKMTYGELKTLIREAVEVQLLESEIQLLEAGYGSLGSISGKGLTTGWFRTIPKKPSKYYHGPETNMAKFLDDKTIGRIALKRSFRASKEFNELTANAGLVHEMIREFKENKEDLKIDKQTIKNLEEELELYTEEIADFMGIVLTRMKVKNHRGNERLEYVDEAIKSSKTDDEAKAVYLAMQKLSSKMKL